MGGLDWLRAWVFSLIFLGWTLCETRKATKAEYQPYIVSLHDQFDVYHYIPDNRNTVINFVGDFVINFTKKVFSQIGDFMTCIPMNGVLLNSTLNLLIPMGTPRIFLKIREMDIFIIVKCSDAFTDKRAYTLHF